MFSGLFSTVDEMECCDGPSEPSVVMTAIQGEHGNTSSLSYNLTIFQIILLFYPSDLTTFKISVQLHTC